MRIWTLQPGSTGCLWLPAHPPCSPDSMVCLHVSESSERICLLEILKSEKQEGTAPSLGICISKKCRYIKDSCYFWGRCAPDSKIPTFIHGSVLPFLETCSSAIRNSCEWVPANPNLQRQAGNFPTCPAQGGVAQGNENRENSPAPSVPGAYHQRIHLQSLCCTNTATRRYTTMHLPQGLNSSLFTRTLYKPRKQRVLCGCFVLFPTGMNDHTLPALTEGMGQI